jgi:cytochrome c553
VSDDDRNIFDGELMGADAANLTGQDMVAITAYLASLQPVKTSHPLTQPLGNATR